MNRIATDTNAVAYLANNFFTPELSAEICDGLRVPYRSNGHRWWLKKGPNAC